MFIAAHTRLAAQTHVVGHPDRLARPGSAPTLRHHKSGLVGALNSEWQTLAADPVNRTVLASWGRRVSALQGLEDLSEVVAAATQRTDREVLAGLLTLAREGDHLAARTALQVMLGAAVRLARRTRAHAGGDHEEAVARAVAATWRAIRTYPLERRACRPADGVSLDVLSELTAGSRAGLAEIASGLPGDLIDHPAEEGPDESDLRACFWSATRIRQAGACDDEQLIVLLAWGVRSGVISRTDARLLLRLHSPENRDGGVTCRDMADELGAGHAAVRQRASRATRRLAAAVRRLVADSELVPCREGTVAA